MSARIDLVQGRMNVDAVPLGRLLTSPEVVVLKDAEVPREGLLVRGPAAFPPRRWLLGEGRDVGGGPQLV